METDSLPLYWGFHFLETSHSLFFVHPGLTYFCQMWLRSQSVMTHFLSSIVPVPEFLHFASLGVSPEAFVLVLAHPADAAVSLVPSVAALLLLVL